MYDNVDAEDGEMEHDYVVDDEDGNEDVNAEDEVKDDTGGG